MAVIRIMTSQVEDRRGLREREEPHSVAPTCEPCLTQGVVLTQNLAAYRRSQKLTGIHFPLSNTQHYFALH